MKYANDKFVNDVIIPNVGEFTENEIEWLLNDYTFKAKGGGTTTYSKLQNGNAQKIEAEWKKQIVDDSDLQLKHRLDELNKMFDTDNYKVTQEDINIFNNTDYAQAARDLFNRSNKHPLQSEENSNYLNSINSTLQASAQDIKIFGEEVL